LFENIRPGLFLNVFLKKFNINECNSKTIQIGDDEENMVFTFYFLNDSLNLISSKLYLD